VTWTVTDIHDNTATATQNVNVSDNRNPTITAPADVIVNTDAGSCAATSVALGTPVTADNCGVASVTNDATSSFPVGTTIVTWTVTDIHDNTSTATQNVIVNDNQNPTITAPADLTVNTDAGLHIASGVALGTPVTTDNCGVATVTNNAPTAFPAGPTTITWTVTDIHRNAATATQTVTVIDNTAPTITSVTTINVTENTTAVMTVTATDTDIGDILTFSISGGTDAAKFTIDANTGELKFITAPDYEIPTDGDLNNIYMLNITVTDAGKLFDTKAISVIVGNINDAPTNIILSKNSVYEELPVGTMVGTLTTIDQDAGDSHIYEILPGNDAISFIISGDILRTTAVFDYKVKSTYSITIRTADQGGLYFDKPFTIIVNNVNEAPKILDNNNNPVDTLYFDAYENETLQVCLNVFDPDGDNVSITDLRLLEGKVKLINSSKTCLSYLSPSGFIGEARFFVQVCDNGAPSLCDSAIIIFNVHPRFIISQAISPNEDEIDDTWLVQGIERYPNNTITIFSRWGDLVYKVKHYDNTNTVWKGQYNTGQKSNINVPDGTYFYIIEIDGMNKPLSGYIVVKR